MLRVQRVKLSPTGLTAASVARTPQGEEQAETISQYIGLHRLRGAQCTYFCADCNMVCGGLCQHCLPEHPPHHTVIQVRPASRLEKSAALLSALPRRVWPPPRRAGAGSWSCFKTPLRCLSKRKLSWRHA